MSKLTDDEIINLIRTRQAGDNKVWYRDTAHKQDWKLVNDSHQWDFKNLDYKIQKRREYVIRIDGQGTPSIYATKNNFTRSDFGKTSEQQNGEYMLLREVYPEEME